MLQCPQCTKPLRELVRRCPTCQADLDLLVDYVSHLQGGLERAENLVRAGELGQAMWAYLEVLEVDPDNATARRQVGQVATAVRQFDFATPGRRWANNLPPLPPSRRGWPTWLWGLIVAAALVVGLALGWLGSSIDWGALSAPADQQEQGPPKKDDSQLGPV